MKTQRYAAFVFLTFTTPLMGNGSGDINSPSPSPIYSALAAHENIFNFDGNAPSAKGKEPTLKNENMPIPVLSIVLQDKGIDIQMTEFLLQELGNSPTSEETEKIDVALNLLKDSKIGAEICNSIGKPSAQSCSWAALTKAGVKITTRDLNRHIPIIDSIASYYLGSFDHPALVPKPSWVKGQTILCLDINLVKNHSPAFIATFVLHEVSHVSDNRRLGESVVGTISNYAAEYKAVAIQMMMHDELLRAGRLKVDHTDPIQFILSVYRWKNGGPPPNSDFSIVIKGERYSAKELIGLYATPGDTGLSALYKLSGFFNDLRIGAIDEKSLKYSRGVGSFMKELERKYQSWFPSKPPVAVNPYIPQQPSQQPSQQPPQQPQQPQQQPPQHPQQPQQPQTPPQQPPYPSDGNSNGEGSPNGGGEEWIPPYTPNPHFKLNNNTVD